MDETLSTAADILVVSPPGAQEQRVALPRTPGHVLRLGRESDNDIVVTDPRVSRYHAEVRRSAAGIEIRDVGSANGTLVGGSRLTAEQWQALAPGVLAYLGDTRLRYEPSAHAATTLGKAPVTAPEPTRPPTTARIPAAAIWLLAIGAIVGLAALVLALVMWMGSGQPPDLPAAVATPPATPGQPPTAATQADPGVPYPVVAVEELSARPIILGALPDPGRALIIVRVRIENHGSGDLIVSPQHFELFDTSGLVLTEVGGTYSEEGLRKLGLADRYEGLRLGPGDSVPESLLFAGKAQPYQLFLRYQPVDLQPVVLDMGALDAAREVALALGTPLPVPTTEATAVAAVAPTPTIVVVPTPTRSPALPAPGTVPASSLTGRIAYPVFNGTTFDLYVAGVDGTERQLLITSASQPQFSPDGSRLAYHSWRSDKRGLVAVDVSGSNERIVARNLEDQLPTWSPDGQKIIFLSRRSGQRASELFVVPAAGDEATIIGNGEYPTWGPDGRLAFKGWMSTGVGLRIGNADLTGVEALSSDETDTAPAFSPDGKQIAFMSRRDGNWNIYVVRTDGTGLTQVTDDLAEDGLPAWSPDGKVVAFVSNRGGPWAVWAAVPESGAERQLFTLEGPPDGFVAGEDLDKSRGWAEERISWRR
jgi:hypothetical protein